MLLRELLEHNIHYNKPPQEASTFHFTAYILDRELCQI